MEAFPEEEKIITLNYMNQTIQEIKKGLKYFKDFSKCIDSQYKIILYTPKNNLTIYSRMPDIEIDKKIEEKINKKKSIFKEVEYQINKIESSDISFFSIRTDKVRKQAQAIYLLLREIYDEPEEFEVKFSFICNKNIDIIPGPQKKTLEKIEEWTIYLRSLSENESPNNFETRIVTPNGEINLDTMGSEISIEINDETAEMMRKNESKFNVGFEFSTGLLSRKVKGVYPKTQDVKEQAMFVYLFLRNFFDAPEEFDVRFGDIWEV